MEVKKYETKSPQYYKTYHKEHYDELHKKRTCDTCGGTFNAYSKAKHERTKKHKIGEELDKIKQKILNL